MDRLISMTDFIIEQSKIGMEVQSISHQLSNRVNRFEKIVKYANFIRQPLTLGMFVPCKLVDGVWVVLEEPIKCAECLDHKDLICDLHKVEFEEYHEAKERVLFEGIEYVEAKTESSYSIVRICKSLSTINYPDFWKGKVVEDLIPYNINLTQSAKKQIGL